ncbi:MAG: YadA C-terminal domain-containing protein, partial [Thermodesulfobacteriota bacterium]
TGDPVVVTGVAEGTTAYDAVNYAQFRREIDRLDKRMDEFAGGVASVAALAAIPSPTNGKCFSIGAGYGNYDGESAIAIGGKACVFSKNIVVTGGAGFSNDQTTINAGIGWSF